MKTMEEIKLLRCPFCGNTNIQETNCRELEDCAHFEVCDTDILYFAYVCSVNHGGCGASTGYYEHKEEAIEAWNKRADNDRNAKGNAVVAEGGQG